MLPSIVPLPPGKPVGTQIPKTAGPRGQRILLAHVVAAIAYSALCYLYFAAQPKSEIAALLEHYGYTLPLFAVHLAVTLVPALIAEFREDGEALYGHVRGLIFAVFIAGFGLFLSCGTAMG